MFYTESLGRSLEKRDNPDSDLRSYPFNIAARFRIIVATERLPERKKKRATVVQMAAWLWTAPDLTALAIWIRLPGRWTRVFFFWDLFRPRPNRAISWVISAVWRGFGQVNGIEQQYWAQPLRIIQSYAWSTGKGKRHSLEQCRPFRQWSLTPT